MIALVAVGTAVSVGGIDDAEPAEETEQGFELAGELAGGPVTVEAAASPTTSSATGSGRSTRSRLEEPADAEAEPDPDPIDCLVADEGGHVWRLTLAEDFAGDSVDLDRWRLYDSPGNAGFGLRRPAAIATIDGHLVITAQMIDGKLVTGGMAHRADQIYGRWEFRVRTDPDPSEATSGVALTWPQSENWPIDGENDMYETGREPDRTPFMTFVHYGADNSQVSLTHDADATDWHVMTMEWTENRLAMYRDGAYVGEITDPEVIPDVAHHMTIQLDAWADTMGDPVRMEVDWVRVHRLDPTATAC